MAKAFVLTAQLNIQAPTNLRPVIQSIQQQLGSVRVNIDVRIDPAAATRVAALNAQLTQLSRTLTNITAATTAIRGLSTALGGLSTSVSTTSRAVSTQSNAFTKAKNSIQEARTEIEAFGFQSALAIRRFAAFSVGTAGILGLVGAFKSGITEAIKFDREMVKLSQVTGVSVRSLKGINDEIGRLATTFGVSSSALLDVSTTLAQAGLSARETRVALEALAKSALAPSFDNLKDTTEGVIASMRQFTLQASDVESALGSINAVSAAFAVESADIITAIRTTGGVFASASKGVSEGKRALNEFISVFTSVRATTRESAESIATGLRTIFTRIQRPRTIEYLKEFGINLQDLEGKFVGPYEAVRRLSEGLKGLDTRDSRFAQVTEELGGYRQLGKVIPAIQQFATAQQALQVATAGSNSLSRDAAVAQQALAVQITKTKEQFLDLVRSFAQSSTFTSLISGTLKLADSFIAIGNAIRPILPYLTILAGIKLSSSLFQFGSGFAGGIKRGGGAGGAGGGLASLITGHRGFATGGLVPGYGNSDSYPADLTPGEFVIRKSAVKALGVDTLDSLNKYASAGPVKGPTAKQLQVANNLSRAEFYALPPAERERLAASYVEPTRAIKETTSSTKRLSPRNLTVDGPYGGLFFQLGSKSGNVTTGPVSISSSELSQQNQSQLAGMFPNNKIGKISGQPYQFYINKQKGDQFDRLAEDSMSKVIDNILATAGGAGAVSQGIGKPIGEVKDIMKKQIGFSAFAGNIFEAYIAAIGRQINPERGRSFDFNPVNPEFQQLFGPNVGQAKYADAKLSATSKSLPSILKKAVSAKLAGAGDIIFRLGNANADAVAARSGKVESALGDTSNIRRTGRATGGQVGSVKSLLTPGEYVMGAGAAKILGPATLNRLNNADRVGFSGGNYVAESQAQFDEEYRKRRSGNDPLTLKSAQATNDIIRQRVADILAANPGMSPRDAYKMAKVGLAKTSVVKDSLSVPAATANREAQLGAPVATRLIRYANADYSPESTLRYAKANPVAIPGQTASATPIAAGYGFTPEAGLVPPPGPSGSSGGDDGGSGGGGIINPGIPNGRVPTRLDRLRSRLGRAGGFLRGSASQYGLAAAFSAGPLAEQAFGAGGTSGFVSGAAGGAAVGGSIGGPIGAGIGALIGGIDGLTKGLKDAELTKAMKDLEVSTTKLDSSFESFAKGRSSIEELSGNAGLATQNIDNIIGKKGLDVTDAYGANFTSVAGVASSIGLGIQGARASAGSVSAANEINSNLDAFQLSKAQEKIGLTTPISQKAIAAFQKEGFKDIGGRDSFGNIQFNEYGKKSQALLGSLATDANNPNAVANARVLNEKTDPKARAELAARLGAAEYDRLKQLNDSMKGLAESAAIANTGLELLSRSFEQVSADVQRVIAESDKRSIVTEDLLGQSGGVARVGRVASRTDVFENNRAYSSDETAAAFQGLGLNAGSTKKLTDTALSTKALTDELPNFILRSFKADSRTDATPEDAAAKGIDEILKSKGLSQDALPSELRAKILDQVKQGTENTQSSSRGLEGFILEFSKSLDDIGKDVFKAGADLQKGLEAANNKYLEGINQYIGAALKVEESRVSNIGADADAKLSFQKLNPLFRDPTGRLSGAGDDARIAEFSGGALNVDDINKRFSTLESQRNSINAARASTPIGNTSAQASLAKALAQVEIEIAKNSKALEIAATASSELTAITTELSRIESARNDARNQLSEKQLSRREARQEQKNAGVLDDAINNPGKIFGRKQTDQLTDAAKKRASDLEAVGDFAGAEAIRKRAAEASFGFKDKNNLFRDKEQRAALALGLEDPNGGKAAQAGLKRITELQEEQKKARDALNNRAAKPLTGIQANLEAQNRETADGVRAAGNKLVPDSFSGDVASLQKAADTLAAMPKTITLEGTHQVNVNITGLAGTNLEGPIGELIKSEVGKAIKQYVPQDQRLEGGKVA